MNCNYQAVSSIPALIILPDKKGTAQLWHPIQSVWGKTHMEWELIIDIWYSDVWGCFFFCSGAFIFEILLPKPPRGSRDADAISVCRLWLKRRFGGKGCNFDTCTWINRRGPRVWNTPHTWTMLLFGADDTLKSRAFQFSVSAPVRCLSCQGHWEGKDLTDECLCSTHKHKHLPL